MYAVELRVGISESDADGRLTLPSLIDYFQNCCSFQSEDLKIGVKYLKKRNLAWVLGSWQIVIDRYPEFDEVIRVVTIPYEIKGFLGMRNFMVLDREDRPIVRANSLWTLLDLQQMKPARVTEEMIAGYGIQERIGMNYAPRRIALPAEMEELTRFRVLPYHIDTNHHMNNNQYIRIAQSFLPDGYETEQLRAEYKAQAFSGDSLVIRRGVTEAGDLVFLFGKDSGETCAVLEFYRRA